MGIFDFLKRTPKVEPQTKYIGEESIDIKHTYQNPTSSSKETSSYQRINIISDTEIGQAVDEYLEKANEAYSDPRLNEHATNELTEYNSIEGQHKKDDAFKYVLDNCQNDPEFIKNCSNYPNPYSYISAIADELDRVYSKTKDERFSYLSDTYKTTLYVYCKKNEVERNIEIFTMLVKDLKNNRQKTKLHKGNFLNQYAHLIGKDYQLGTDPMTIGNKYFEVYKDYLIYEHQLLKIIKECKEFKINYHEIFDGYGIVYASNFNDYYNYENKEILESSLQTVTPIINQLIKLKMIEEISEELKEHPVFIENANLYGGPIAFITNLIEELTTMYESTKNPKLDPNNKYYVKALCRTSEEERESIFERLTTEEIKGIKK